VTASRSPSKSPVVIDLYSDWIESLRSALRADGYDPPADEPLKTAIRFFNVKLRKIAAKPRIVERAKSLVFAPEFGAAIAEIERKAIVGESLTPHLTAC